MRTADAIDPGFAPLQESLADQVEDLQAPLLLRHVCVTGNEMEVDMSGIGRFRKKNDVDLSRPVARKVATARSTSSSLRYSSSIPLGDTVDFTFTRKNARNLPVRSTRMDGSITGVQSPPITQQHLAKTPAR